MPDDEVTQLVLVTVSPSVVLCTTSRQPVVTLPVTSVNMYVKVVLAMIMVNIIGFFHLSWSILISFIIVGGMTLYRINKS